MQPQDFITDFRQRIQDHAPKGASEAKGLLQSMLAKLNLVSREEFDAQQAVLLRTRAKLEQLEKQLAEIQAKL